MTFNVPKLRFKEFKEEWNKTNLDEIGTVISGLTYSPKDIRKDGLLVLRSSNIQKDQIVYDDCVYVRGDIRGANISQKGDIIICVRNGSSNLIGKNSIIKNNSIKSTHGAFMISFRSKVPDFTVQLFKTRQYKKQVYVDLGARINSINSVQFKKYKFYLPKINEQQKIASFLGKTDEWVGNLKEQKEDLEKYKKSMMQKIFAQKIRFRDENGKEFVEWEEKKLGDILKERNDFSIKGKGYTHISLTTKGVVPKSERYDRDFLVGNDETKGYKITRLNDLCYNPANLKFGVISINKLGAGIFSPIYVTFEIVGQNLDFVGYYLIRDAFINKARRYEQGTVYERMAVHPSDFVKVKVLFPSLPEQQKIADFLTSIDKIIDSKQEKIAKAEEWKKGLMQGLFV